MIIHIICIISIKVQLNKIAWVLHTGGSLHKGFPSHMTPPWSMCLLLLRRRWPVATNLLGVWNSEAKRSQAFSASPSTCRQKQKEYANMHASDLPFPIDSFCTFAQSDCMQLDLTSKLSNIPYLGISQKTGDFFESDASSPIIACTFILILIVTCRERQKHNHPAHSAVRTRL